MQQETVTFIAMGGVLSRQKNAFACFFRWTYIQLFHDTSPEICIACHNTVVKALFKLIQIILEYGNKIVQYGTTKEKLEVFGWEEGAWNITAESQWMVDLP